MHPGTPAKLQIPIHPPPFGNSGQIRKKNDATCGLSCGAICQGKVGLGTANSEFGVRFGFKAAAGCEFHGLLSFSVGALKVSSLAAELGMLGLRIPI